MDYKSLETGMILEDTEGHELLVVGWKNGTVHIMHEKHETWEVPEGCWIPENNYLKDWF